MRSFGFSLLSCACLFLSPSVHGVERQDPAFILHNLHFQKFEEPGFAAGNVVHAVHLDRKGRLWFGTEGGLFLYDGNEVRTFGQHENGRDGLPNYFAKAIAETPDGTVWIGTWGGGIAYFDEASRSMRVPEMTADGASKLPFDGKLWSMGVDSRNRLWLGTFSSGLFLLDPATGRLQGIFQPETEDTARARRIDSLFIDERDRIWFVPFGYPVRVIDAHTLRPLPELEQRVHACTGDSRSQDVAAFPDGRVVILLQQGLCVLDEDGQTLVRLDIPLSNNDGVAMEALPYTERSVLVGTANRLWYVDIESGELFPLPAGQRTAAIEPAIVWDMDQTAEGDLLIGGTQGVWINTAVSRQFWTVALAAGQGEFFENTRALVHEGEKLLLNSVSNLYEIDFDGELKHPRLLGGRTVNSAPIGYPMTMVSTPGGNWLGTDSRIIRFDLEGGLSELKGAAGGAHALLYDETWQRLLAHGPYGLVAIDAVAGTVIGRTSPYGTNDAHGSHPVGLHLSFGNHDDVWAGTFTGMFRYDRNTLAALPVFGEPPTNWNHPLVAFVHALSDKELVIGTGDGLFRARLDDAGAIVELERQFTGTAWGKGSFGAVFDAGPGRLLFATDYGLVEFNHEDGTYRTLFQDDGMVTYRVYMGGFRQSVQDLGMLSGEDGPLLMRPNEIVVEAPPPSLVIADVLTFRGNSTKAWPLTERLTFRHEDKVIRFKFGLLDYLHAENNRYRLRLKGFSDDWLDIGRLNEFSFTNLDAGDYRLEIHATDGVVDIPDVASLDFTVLPPWWQTWWAYALYAAVILGSLFVYWMSLQRKIRREQEISQRLREADRIKSHFLSELEEKVELATQDLRHAVEALEIKNVELDAAQHRALDASRLKSEFLANMSHEIRTPMNGILGFTQLLAKSPLDNDQRDYVDTIEKSATSLLGIINDVLDVSKVEAGKLMIDSTGFGLRQCVSDTLEALTAIAYEKNLELVSHVDEDLPEGLRGDPVRLRQMITNLVGNAVKFTDAGHVIVHVAQRGDDAGTWLSVGVRDTGRGITAEDRERLFQAFERGHVNLAGRYTGTGLGLVITKKLCEAMGGRITLDSMPGKGTEITLELPLIPDRNSENRYGFGRPLIGRRVLLIDGDAPSRDALRARFTHWGADVTAVADLAGPPGISPDIAVIGIGRRKLGDATALRALCERLPADVPRLCLAATVDREALRSIGNACGGADCVPKVGYKEGLLRRLLALLDIDRPETKERSAPAAARELENLHVVIADDNRVNRYFLRKILELHGARITEADSGVGVLRALDADDAADIALLDVHMPDMDGLEVARRIRARGMTDLPLLAVSANIQPETYEAALAAGINDYLLKPVDENKLVEAILEWTGREETA